MFRGISAHKLIAVTCLLLLPLVSASAQAVPTIEDLWADVASATDAEDAAALARASAIFIDQAPEDDERLPEAWFQFLTASRDLLADVGDGPYEILLDLVGRMHEKWPDSEWTLKAYELLAEDGARRVLLHDHLHPIFGGFGNAALDRLTGDTSREGILRLGEYAHNWILTHRGSCDIGGGYSDDGCAMLAFVGYVLHHLYQVMEGAPTPIKAACVYAQARTMHAHGSSRARNRYAVLIAPYGGFTSDPLAARARRQLEAGVSDPLDPDRPHGEWAGGDRRRRITEALGDIPYPGGD